MAKLGLVKLGRSVGSKKQAKSMTARNKKASSFVNLRTMRRKLGK